MAKRDDGKKTTGLNQPFAELARASREAKRKQAYDAWTTWWNTNGKSFLEA